MVNEECDTCMINQDEAGGTNCEGCLKCYAKKEVIIAEADNSDYIHGDGYETTFGTKHYDNIISTQYRWKGKVKITIEQLDE